eukprot:symbB.v1.2.019910.t1/scaffold1583.1/size183753/10
MDVISYSAAISACEKSNEWQQSIRLLSELRSATLESDLILFNSVLSACSKGFQWTVALELLDCMAASGLSNDEISLDVAIMACAGMYQWSKALDLVAISRSVGCTSGGLRACEAVGGGVDGVQVLLQRLHVQGPKRSIPIINIRIGHGAYSFARLADPRLASTAVHIGEMFINGKKVLLRRPVHCDGHVSLPPPLDVIRALPKPPPVEGFRAHSDEGERLANQAKGAQAVNLEPAKEVPAVREIPPNPPKVPIVMPWHRRVHSVWVGNLPGRDQILAGMEEDDDEDDKGHKVLEVELMSRRLDQRLNELALKMPGYTLEDGPVIKRLSVHPSGRYAFVRVMGDQDFVEYLLDAWENQDFLGNPLRVAWQRRKDNPFMHKDKKRRLRRPLQVPAGLSEWLKPPIPDDDTAPRTEPFTAKEIEEL